MSIWLLVSLLFLLLCLKICENSSDLVYIAKDEEDFIRKVEEAVKEAKSPNKELIMRRIKLIEPVDYLTFLKLLNNAKLVFTDSGGVQEEACILKVPCVTLRYNTERPETLEVGSNMLAGSETEFILEKATLMINKKREWKNPFGDGKASERIIKILTSAKNV